MAEAAHTIESINQQTARLAAQSAAESIRREMQTRSKGGNVALYVWGCIAGTCAGLALVSVTAPLIVTGFGSEVHVQMPQPDVQLAEAPPEVRALLSSKPVQLDYQTTASVAPEKETAVEDVEETGIDKTSVAIEFLERTEQKLFGAVVGKSGASHELGARFSALSRRAPDLFSSLEPRIGSVEADGYSFTNLIVGPFSSGAELAGFCRSLKLRLTMECAASEFTGAPLSPVITASR